MDVTPLPNQSRRLDLILQQLEQVPALSAAAVKALQVSGNDLGAVHGALHSIIQTFPPEDIISGSGLNRSEFWKHCIAVASLAELLAEQLEPDSRQLRVLPCEAFACGLLHDLGKVALDAIMPKSYARAIDAAELLRGNIAELERSIIGLDHNLAGKRLCEQWTLPANVRDCAWLHGQSPDALPSAGVHSRLINLITLADALARQQHIGFSGNFTNALDLEQLALSIGLNDHSIEEAKRQLMDRIAQRACTLKLAVPPPAEMYQQSLGRANRELGRAIEHLASKTRKMALRARLFDLLSDFGAQLRPDAAPNAVLKAIGPAAMTVLGVSAVAVFSLTPGKALAEAVLYNQSGQMFEQTILDFDGEPDVGNASDGPVLCTGPELQWLLSAVDPRLKGECRFWSRLVADGQCIGGIVWGASAGEAQRLGAQVSELHAIVGAWSMWLRGAQVRESARHLSEQLAARSAELSAAQEQLHRCRMMVSVGEMAAGAAHEMNNPLSVISGRSQLLAQQLTDPKHRAAANIIHEQSHRLSQIITELMDYAKPVPPAVAECDVAEVVARALHEAKTHADVADRTIELTMGDVPPVLVDEKQVAAALAELIHNAISATDAKTGQITIRAALDPSGHTTDVDGMPAGRVVIAVTDNGTGMDAQTLQRAFDPFFSAKSAGRRRGLGLAKALRWAQSSAGTIRLESKANQGTRALLIVPATGLNGSSALTQDKNRQRTAG